MNYTRDERPVGCCESKILPDCLPGEMESITELMHSTGAVGQAVLGMVERLNRHLFGIHGHEFEEKSPSPCCFREELAEHRRKLEAAANALARLCDMIGA